MLKECPVSNSPSPQYQCCSCLHSGTASYRYMSCILKWRGTNWSFSLSQSTISSSVGSWMKKWTLRPLLCTGKKTKAYPTQSQLFYSSVTKGIPTIWVLPLRCRCGPLIDLCRGPHVRHTGKIKALKIHKVSNETLHWLSLPSIFLQAGSLVVSFLQDVLEF